MLVLDNFHSKHRSGKVLIPWFYGQDRPAVAFCRERSALVNEAGIRSRGASLPVERRQAFSLLPTLSEDVEFARYYSGLDFDVVR
ncbi:MULTISPECIES: hypothetical protein [unclassified Bradyrhizobium]|uniref:hypothetical protein n=1 Tax=unclassified Bradyrhizobium TaxID=2631580 RepID=UPI001FF912C9|nr:MULTISPECIES: hypothetical protein [unclassified Bradyrhizobium]